MEKSRAEMNSISEYQPSPHTSRQRRARAIWGSSLLAIFLCIVTYILFYHTGSLPNYSSEDIPLSDWSTAPGDGFRPAQEVVTSGQNAESPSSAKNVPFEAHVMSKCPDARACLQKLVLPSMEQIHDKVDFRLSFIGNASSSSDAVSCMHGPAECIGNMIILCAANLPFPPGSSTGNKTPPIRSLGFANCLISSYSDIPGRALTENCAYEHGIDFQALNRCLSRGLDGEKGDDVSGLALLRESFTHSKEVGASTSCTVRVDEKVWCVHDGGEWSDCGEGAKRSKVSAVVKEVERLWDERN